MKKFTGILAVSLFAIMTAPAARAELAATTYVDTAVAGKADKATTLAGYGITDAATKTELTTGLAGKQDTIGYTPENVENKKSDFQNVAQTGDMTYPTRAAVKNYISGQFAGVNTKIGDMANLGTTETDSLVGAINELNIGKANATQVASDIAAAVKTETDRATAAESALAGRVTANEGAISAINNTSTGILKQSKDYTDGKIADINTSLEGYATKTQIADLDMTAADTTGDANGVITAVSQTDGKVSATKALIVNANVAADAAIASSKVAFTADQTGVFNSGITATKVSGYDTVKSAVEDTSTGLAATKKIADNAAAAAAAAQETADDKLATVSTTGTGIVKAVVQDGTNVKVTAGALTTDEIPNLGMGKITGLDTALNAKVNNADLGALAKAAPGACSDKTNKCVLTFDGTAYAWEVIGR